MRLDGAWQATVPRPVQDNYADAEMVVDAMVTWRRLRRREQLEKY